MKDGTGIHGFQSMEFIYSRFLRTEIIVDLQYDLGKPATNFPFILFQVCKQYLLYNYLYIQMYILIKYSIKNNQLCGQ